MLFLSEASANVTAVSEWMAENWDATVSEVLTLATWRHVNFKPTLKQVEEAFLLNDGDVERTLTHITPKQVSH